MMSLSGTKRCREEGEDIVATEDDLFELTDTEAALQLITNSVESRDVPRGAFVHQIYTVLTNKTDVDTTLQWLRTKKSFKVLFCPLDGLSPTDSQFLVMSLSDYISDLDGHIGKYIAESSQGLLVRALVAFRPWISYLSERSSVHRNVFTTIGAACSISSSSSSSTDATLDSETKATVSPRWPTALSDQEIDGTLVSLSLGVLYTADRSTSVHLVSSCTAHCSAFSVVSS